MMTFTTEEMFSSVIFALAYGAIFAIFLSFIVILKQSISLMLDMLKTTLDFEKIFPLPSFGKMKINHKSNTFISVVSIFLFAVGFSLLSYLSLDGQIRLYMLVLSFASFYLSKTAFIGILSWMILFVVKALFILLAPVLRIVLWLPKRVYNHFHLIKNK